MQRLCSRSAVAMQTTAAREPKRGGTPGAGAAIITRTRTQTKRPSMYRVLLLNDDYTPMEFVISILQAFFNKDAQEASASWKRSERRPHAEHPQPDRHAARRARGGPGPPKGSKRGVGGDASRRSGSRQHPKRPGTRVWFQFHSPLPRGHVGVTMTMSMVQFMDGT
jgi:hypothetical protein